jgi:hypothetical protein
MKLTPQQIERIALWSVVLLLIIVVVVFSQRRSGFTPTAGTPISLMDLQEFSIFTTEQKKMYSNLLTTPEVLSQLTQAAQSKSVETLQTAIRGLMTMALNGGGLPPPDVSQPAPPPVTPQVQCAPGSYSPTGNSPCMPCPAGTYCATRGMITPTMCPPNTYCSTIGTITPTMCPTPKTSPAGSSSLSMCVTPPVTPQVQCAPGSYSPTGNSPCMPCPAGTYSSTTGAPSCTRCPGGTYNSNTGSTSVSACMKCPATKPTSLPGSVSSSQCR